jgi:hypothetical protein
MTVVAGMGPTTSEWIPACAQMSYRVTSIEPFIPGCSPHV